MKIRTSFPGQPVRIVDAMPHTEQQLLAGKTFPFIEMVSESGETRERVLLRQALLLLKQVHQGIQLRNSYPTSELVSTIHDIDKLLKEKP